MAGQAHGKAFGRELTRAMSEPWDGNILTGRGTADALGNDYINLAVGCLPQRATVPTGHVPIKGVAVQGDSNNTGSIYVIGVGQDGNPAAGDQGWELTAGNSISLAVDDLCKVNVFVPTGADRVRYCAIAAANAVEP